MSCDPDKDIYVIPKRGGLDIHIEGNKHELKLTKDQQVGLVLEILTKWQEDEWHEKMH